MNRIFMTIIKQFVLIVIILNIASFIFFAQINPIQDICKSTEELRGPDRLLTPALALICLFEANNSISCHSKEECPYEPEKYK